MIGDLLIITAYASYSKDELAAYQPIIVLVDEHNRPKPLHASTFQQ
jgi:aspartate 1-decarboxylase